jgi:hypothetical protein
VKNMSAIRTICAGLTAIIGTGVWVYFVLYNWLWLGIVNSAETRWIVGYGILFIIFIILTFVVLPLLYALCFLIAVNLWD